MLGRFKNHYAIDIAAILATFVFVLAGALVSLNRFWQYEVFYYNFGVFDQAIWHVSRFQPPVIEHLLVGNKISLADHFDLSIFLLAPLFWFTDRSEVLLIAQALFAGLAGLVIYKIGVLVLKDKVLALTVACCYFLFVGIQNAVITDFHELTVMSFPIALTFLAIIKKNLRLFWLFFLITLGFKEVTFLLGIGIAIFIFFYFASEKPRLSKRGMKAEDLVQRAKEGEIHNRRWKVHAMLAIGVSIVWGYLTINVLIPYFSQGVYLHQPAMPDGIVNKVVALFDHPSKRHTLFFSLLNFGFLPVLAPQMWFVIVQDYVLRFIPKFVETRWGLGLHYNAQVAPLLAIGMIFGFSFLQKFKRFAQFRYIVAFLLIANAFIQFRFIHHGPFLLAVHPVFYKHTSEFTFLDDMIAKIPPDATVMAQNNLGVRFTHKKFIYLRYNYEQYAPDYMLIDNRPGQNPNNFLFSPTPTEMLEKLSKDAHYATFYHKGDQYIFQRRK